VHSQNLTFLISEPNNAQDLSYFQYPYPALIFSFPKMQHHIILVSYHPPTTVQYLKIWPSQLLTSVCEVYCQRSNRIL